MPERKPVSPAGAGPSGAPNQAALSPGMIVGDLLFVSGHVAVDTSGDVVGEGDAEAQTRQVMANIRAVIDAAGGKMEDVAKITCFITDIASYPAYSKVRSETWPSSPPASSTVVVAGLVSPEFMVEVEAIVRLA
jgi:enamine deaminase RidA (YjgF/YER057c/UK114 family)